MIPKTKMLKQVEQNTASITNIGNRLDNVRVCKIGFTDTKLSFDYYIGNRGAALVLITPNSNVNGNLWSIHWNNCKVGNMINTYRVFGNNTYGNLTSAINRDYYLTITYNVAWSVGFIVMSIQ